ncbi:MAG: hypothetical protein EAY75_03185 [Bacteroidetes bacterium]|nr:MAG: hypothetical protein EAY75_03185 [Bacteroidota bacterium]
MQALAHRCWHTCVGAWALVQGKCYTGVGTQPDYTSQLQKRRYKHLDYITAAKLQLNGYALRLAVQAVQLKCLKLPLAEVMLWAVAQMPREYDTCGRPLHGKLTAPLCARDWQ